MTFARPQSVFFILSETVEKSRILMGIEICSSDFSPSGRREPSLTAVVHVMNGTLFHVWCFLCCFSPSFIFLSFFRKQEKSVMHSCAHIAQCLPSNFTFEQFVSLLQDLEIRNLFYRQRIFFACFMPFFQKYVIDNGKKGILCNGFTDVTHFVDHHNLAFTNQAVIYKTKCNWMPLQV